MLDRQGTKILENDLVMVWFMKERWVAGRVKKFYESEDSIEVQVGWQAHISPHSSDVVVIQDPHPELAPETLVGDLVSLAKSPK